MAGLFVFEGPNRVGKTTVTSEVEKRLHLAGLACSSISFPGKEHGTIGAHVYKLHHDLAHYNVVRLSPLSLQLLHVAAHVDAIERTILPLIREGRTILLDRYWWSTYAYGIAAGIPAPQLEMAIAVEKLVWGGVIPTTLFLLSRQQASAIPALVDGYQILARQEANNYPVIAIKNEDTIGSIAEEVTRLILTAS